jgi:hypothetical protein
MSQHEADIVLVYADDWEGLYSDGVLEFEGHTIDAHTALKYLIDYNVKLKSISTYEITGEWIYEEGRLPNLLSVVHNKDAKELE